MNGVAGVSLERRRSCANRVGAEERGEPVAVGFHRRARLGNVPYTMVIRDQYDGILFIDSTNPPKYL